MVTAPVLATREIKLHETTRIKRSTNSPIALLMIRGARSRIIGTGISKDSNPATVQATITSSLIQRFRRACEDEELLPMDQGQHPSMEQAQHPSIKQAQQQLMKQAPQP